MKKILALSLLASAAAASFAQSSVTIYGIVDLGATRVSGLRGGSMSQLNSGIMDGSRLGFRGNEDLGGGYRALFTLESRLEADTGLVSNRPPSGSQVPDRISQAALMGLPQVAAIQGAVTNVAIAVGPQIGVNHLTNTFWDRQAFIGLVTPFGAFLAGRQYTPAYEITATFDTLQTQSALSAGQVASFPASIDIRQSNSIQYRIQQGGFTANLMVAAAEGSATTGKFYGGMVMYKTAGWSAGVGHNTRENERGEESLTSTFAGATVKLGPGSASVLLGQWKDNNPSGLAGTFATLNAALGPTFGGLIKAAYKQDARLMHVGYKLEMGANTVYVAYSKADDKRRANADTASYGVTYSYALSKRTDINAAAVRFVNSGLGQAAPGGTGYIGGVTASAGTDSTSLALGVRHRF